MRANFPVILILTAIALTSCCKDKDPSVPYFDFVVYWEGLQEQGSAEADIFDKKWKASAYVFPHPTEPNYFSLIYETFTTDNLLREQILLGTLSAKIGEYKVISDFTMDVFDDNKVNGDYSVFSDDGDVISGSYRINHNYENVVYIDNVDTINHLMEGRFSLMFDLDESDYDKDLARRVHFENGKFKVKI